MPGRVMSRIRQLGPSQRPLFKNCSAVSKLSDCRLADFSRPWIDARIRGSSSTMNTMDDSVAMRNLILNGSGLRKWRDQLIPRATPSAFPVTEQVASLAALEQCSAWIGSRRTRYNGVGHRHTHLTNAIVAIINGRKRRGVLFWRCRSLPD